MLLSGSSSLLKWNTGFELYPNGASKKVYADLPHIVMRLLFFGSVCDLQIYCKANYAT